MFCFVDSESCVKELLRISHTLVGFLRHWGQRFWQNKDGWVWETLVPNYVPGYRLGDVGTYLHHWSLEACQSDALEQQATYRRNGQSTRTTAAANAASVCPRR